MLFQRAVIVFAMALTTLAQNILASPSLCVVYTVVESAFPIEACFTVNTIISIESVTPVSITNAPTCITTIVTASTTLTGPVLSATLLSETTLTLVESIQPKNTMAAIASPASNALSTTELSSSVLTTLVVIISSSSVADPITTTTLSLVAASTTIASPTPSPSTCNKDFYIPPPVPTQGGTTPYCCQWYVVMPGDTCDIITTKLDKTAGSIYELNPELLADCYNLAESFAYCVSGNPQIVAAPQPLFFIVAEDSYTVADETFLMGGLADHAPMGFNMVDGEETPTFTYDPVTGFLTTGLYNVYAEALAGPGPLLLVTYTPYDAEGLPGVFPLVCIVTLGSNLYCNANGGASDRLFLFSYQGQTVLGLGNGFGSPIAPVGLFLEEAI